MVSEAARSQHVPEDWPPNAMHSLTVQVMRSGLRYVFPEHDTKISDDERARRKRQYNRIADVWIRHPLMNEELRRAFDDPARLGDIYPPFVTGILQSDASGSADLTTAADSLGRLSELYPLSSGIAIHRAMLVHRLDRTAEARSILKSAMSRAVVSEGRGECQQWLDKMGG